MDKLEKKKKFDYKWVIIALCFISIFAALGFCSSTNQYFLEPVTEYLDVSRTSFSIILTIRYIVVAIMNLFFGVLVVKFGPKKLMLGGFLSLILAMLIFTFAENLLLFYLGGAFLGLGFAWTGTSVIGYVVNLWCKENRGTIMGAILCANGLGGALAMRIVSKILRTDLYNPSYKAAYFIIAGIIFLVFILILIFFKDKPKNFEGEMQKPSKKKGRGQAWSGIEFSEAKKKTYFYLVLGCIFFTGLALTAVGTVSKAHMSGEGLNPDYIDVVLVAHSIALAAFKFLTGFIYDKFGLRITSTLCCATGVIVMVCLALVTNSTTGMVLAIVYGVFSSLALPLETVMLPIYANDLFGEKSFGKVIGLITAFNTAGYAVGAPLSNVCFDLLGNYRLSLFICAGIMLAVVITLQYVITKAHKIRNEIVSQEETAEETVA